MSRATHALVDARVEISPHFDRWIRGDRFGVVVKAIKGGKVVVKMDKSGKEVTFRPEDLKSVG